MPAQPGVARSPLRWLPLGLVAAGAAVYANSLSGAFVGDDRRWIVFADEIRTLSDWPVLLGETTRPLLKLSFALNYAVSGPEAPGFHVANLAIHILAALVLTSIMRRTLLRAGFQGGPRGAAGLAFAVGLLWLVHPLQTQAVTYVVQRGESMMSLFYLTTLYCVIRCAEGPARAAWGFGAVAACALGAGTKEVMVTAPLVVLLYDRTFLAGSFATALRTRWGLYAGLIGALIGVLFGAIGFDTLFRGEFARPDLPTPTPLAYALTQPAVLLHYLRLVLWPHPLCFSYAWPMASGAGEIVPAALGLGMLLLGTLWALVRRPPLGFVGAWFFLILAPTSSAMPIQEAAVEHRMYLPLAAPLALLVIGIHRALARAGVPPGWAAAALAVAAACLAAVTIQRNHDYRSRVALWQTVVAAAPANPRGYYNVGTLLRREGDLDGAILALERTIELDPDYHGVHYNLGNALRQRGDTDEAILHYRRALELEPEHAGAHTNLGNAFRERGELDDAILHYQRALASKPSRIYASFAHYNLATAREAQGRSEEAIRHYRETLARTPNLAKAHNNLGNLLLASGRTDEAITHYQKALTVEPDHAKAHFNLGVALEEQGDLRTAAVRYQRALTLEPGYTRARDRLEALTERGSKPDAPPAREPASEAGRAP